MYLPSSAVVLRLYLEGTHWSFFAVGLIWTRSTGATSSESSGDCLFMSIFVVSIDFVLQVDRGCRYRSTLSDPGLRDQTVAHANGACLLCSPTQRRAGFFVRLGFA